MSNSSRKRRVTDDVSGESVKRNVYPDRCVGTVPAKGTLLLPE